jgi:hypothetical protein
VIYSRQVYVRAVLLPTLQVFLHVDEGFVTDPDSGTPMRQDGDGWLFDVANDGFQGTLRLELESVPETGAPTAYSA